MHELSIMCSVIEMVNEICVENNIKNVDEITLHIGELTCVENKALNFAFKAMKKEENLEKANLKIENIKGEAYCENCKKEYNINLANRLCPICKSFSYKIIKGEEILLYRVEGE